MKRFLRFTSSKDAIDCDLKSADGWETTMFMERWKKRKLLSNRNFEKNMEYFLTSNDTNLAEALQQAESDRMIQPGLIVIGDRRYIKTVLENSRLKKEENQTDGPWE
uniref:Uncharacterized protein n=1 Tax=Daphnia galeata TaxID=27404 RepID=A0A8J2S7U2_9CRUS|nr:unnamed protein product [Daphnia galeata]